MTGDIMPDDKTNLYSLSTGQKITSLVQFTSPTDEYIAAFEEQNSTFLNYYTFQEGNIQKRVFTRGEFWNMANAAAGLLTNLGLKKGDRIVHAFSANSPFDLAFRLAAVLTGCVPVTINWQSDDNELIIYKAKITHAKLIIYDVEFTSRVEQVKQKTDSISILEAERVGESHDSSQLTYAPLSYDDERMIVFTSGTTGKPKGVSLPHRSYLANRLTFEHYFGIEETSKLDLLLVNPMHHSNSSAISDWGMRRKGAIINLVQRYSTDYWKILTETAENMRDRLIAPLVSRHFDFLQTLIKESNLPVEEAAIKKALGKTDILIGSAPVGPTTVNRILKFSNRLPHVRFGSTETCLQVIATPAAMPDDELMDVFKAGWSHRYQGRDITGYYIGREHPPFTRVRIVKSIDPDSNEFMQISDIGEPGYLVTQGPNIMSCYAGNPDATKAVFKEGWYTGLKDVVFALNNKKDGQLDYYWTSRESELLIRGGANYAYDQIAAELKKFALEHFKLQPDELQLAVVGLRLESEHEDSCCVTIELGEEASGIRIELESAFIDKAHHSVSKGARPDHVRFAPIPRNFKGAILYLQLKQDFRDWIEDNK